MKKYFLLLLIIALFTSCRESNIRIEKYPKNTEYNGEPIFSIDSTMSNNIYLTKKMFFSDNRMDASIFSFYVRDNKFYAKTIEPESNVFILFDLKSRLNKTNKIDFKNAKMMKSFDCILEKRITTKENLEIGVFRIKKWVKLSDFFGGKELDVIVFVTQKYGVIGSYTTDINRIGNPSMISPKGDILKDYIDYSKIEEVELL
jgi:hypothetical protein